MERVLTSDDARVTALEIEVAGLKARLALLEELVGRLVGRKENAE